MEEDKLAYIAKCKCGGIVMACATDRPKDAAKKVADCIKGGFEIGMMKVEDVRKAKWCSNSGNCKQIFEPLLKQNKNKE